MNLVNKVLTKKFKVLFLQCLLLYITDPTFKVESNVESDEHRIAMRLKQISYGKNTAGYDAYIAAVPK
jgi:hypothetical protein